MIYKCITIFTINTVLLESVSVSLSTLTHRRINILEQILGYGRINK